MKTFLKKNLKILLPEFIINLYRNINSFVSWKNRQYLDNAPQYIKQKVFLKHSKPENTWVETGTHLGVTTNFLSKNFTEVHSIEPGDELFLKACKKFDCVPVNNEIEIKSFKSNFKKIFLYNGTSEKIFPQLLPKLKGNISFWLDGHYSGLNTFLGERHSPIKEELDAIEKNLKNFNDVNILIDDARAFVPSDDSNNPDPNINFFVDWAKRNNFFWKIEYDIFIMKNYYFSK